MAGYCIDVCTEVCGKLVEAGYDVGDDEDHQPIFNALNGCVLVSRGRYERLVAACKVAAKELFEIGCEHDLASGQAGNDCPVCALHGILSEIGACPCGAH